MSTCTSGLAIAAPVADQYQSRDLDAEKMKKVAGLLSDLFTSSFRLAVPSLFRGMIQKWVVEWVAVRLGSHF